MYRTECRKSKNEEGTCVVYGISDDSGFYFDFTADENEANEFAAFLNENDVESCHVAEVIEDFFYSCK